MAVKVNVTGGDRIEAHLAGIAERLKKANTVACGFFEGARYPDGTPVAMIAAIQNYGAPRVGIPPRPFFSNMVKKSGPTWPGKVAALLKHNDYDTGKTLGMMGADMEGDLRQSIIDTVAPPLSPVTLLLRDRFWSNPEEIKFADVMQARADLRDGKKPQAGGTQAKPLVWTGQLLRSVGSEVS